MKKSVFLIDDDEDVRDVVKFALEEDGFTVHDFEDALQGYESLSSLSRENFPGLIIVDFQMPNMDGATFINKVKNDHAATLGKIPMALCSAQESDEVPSNLPREILQLPKPMELESLLKLVRTHCR